VGVLGILSGSCIIVGIVQMECMWYVGPGYHRAVLSGGFVLLVAGSGGACEECEMGIVDDGAISASSPTSPRPRFRISSLTIRLLPPHQLVSYKYGE
jgi:hypothetical protein